MSVDIRLKHSSEAGKVPDAGSLKSGEVAINTKDVKAYIKNADGEVVQIAGADNPTTDGRYLKLAADAGDQAVESTGTTTFDGLVEAGGGVKVTGGTANNVVDGIARAATTLNFIKDSQARLFIGSDRIGVIGQLATASTETVGMSIDVAIPEGVTRHSAFKLNAKGNNTTDAVYRGLWFTGDSATGTWSESRGVFIGDDADIGDTNYGIYSALNNPNSKTNYNFYAIGNAPNYFAGPIFTKGTLSTNNSNDRLVVQSTVANNDNAPLVCTGAGSDSANRACIVFRGLSGSTSTNVGGIRIDSGNGSISVWGTSDYRVKKNITPFVNASDTLKNVNVVNYEFTDRAPGKVYQGFVAHQLQEVLPQAVTGLKDEEEAIGTLADYDGTVLQTEVTEPAAEELTYTVEVVDEQQPTIEGEEPRMVEVTRTRTWTATGTRPVYQGVDQTKLIPLLTKALQEALERIEALEAAAGDGVKGTTRKRKS